MAESRSEIYDVTAKATYLSRSASYVLHRASLAAYEMELFENLKIPE